MPISTSISALRSLYPFPVRARQQGGYDRAQIPDPNNPRDLYGALANPSGSPTHIAGGMSAQEYNALQAKQAQGRSEQARQQADMRDGLDRVIQGLKTVNTSKAEDAFFGALHSQGVDRLRTGAAAGMDRGPSTYDMKTGATYSSVRPGFFDTQVGQQGQAYDPRSARAGEMPADAPYAQYQQQGAGQQALSGLRQSVYEPHTPVPRRNPLPQEAREQRQAAVDAARRSVEQLQDDAFTAEERAREERAKYLDAEDAKRGRTNVRRR